MLILLSVLAVVLVACHGYSFSSSSREKAAALLQQMNQTEKLSMLHGLGFQGYVGYVAAIERLGVPPLTLNDGPQGFRDDAHPGTTTAYPSGLTLGASFDEELCYRWGEAMGIEFLGKGSNVQLGPGMNLARVPLNGRNFEYISGGDPVLGRQLVGAVVKGIQGTGVIANAKHWVENNQETDRDTVSENVDERTRHELYYVPFEGAVDAGVGSFMCSYNKINDIWSCENSVTLKQDLKQTLGYPGWVMSDWGATHSVSINAGLDQEMPEGAFFGDALAKQVEAGTVTQATIDESVTRILEPMLEMGLFDRPFPPADASAMANDVTSPEHNSLAREISANTHVLLKNRDSVLPLLDQEEATAPIKIALFGKLARSPIVAGGGSGAVFPKYVVSPYQGVMNALGMADQITHISYECSANSTYLHDVGYHQGGCQSAPSTSPEDCCAQCGAYGLCEYWTFSGDRCSFYPTNGQKGVSKGFTSGACKKTAPAPSWQCNEFKQCVLVYDGSDLDLAASLAAEADVSIVAVGTFACEGSDRPFLSFAPFTSSQCQLPPAGQDQLIQIIAAANTKTVVAIVAPGAVLMPWSNDVHAILHGFMPGQEYGNALADVLFGHVNPSARLPLTIPNSENEVGFTPSQYPGVKKQGDYSEGMLIDYRWYTAHQVKPVFAFGHGLSYASFSYSNLLIATSSSSSSASSNSLLITVTFDVKNTHLTVAGREVAQMYLAFPASANTPPLQLKGFYKTPLLSAGQVSQVSFAITQRDVSVWNVETHAWQVASGTFGVLVGGASDALVLKGEFVV